MHLDDELQSLVMRVVEQFGEDVLSAALSRALAEAQKQEEPISPASSWADVTGGITDGLRVIPPGVFEDALRTELRRLARPQ